MRPDQRLLLPLPGRGGIVLIPWPPMIPAERSCATDRGVKDSPQRRAENNKPPLSSALVIEVHGEFRWPNSTCRKKQGASSNCSAAVVPPRYCQWIFIRQISMRLMPFDVRFRKSRRREEGVRSPATRSG